MWRRPRAELGPEGDRQAALGETPRAVRSALHDINRVSDHDVIRLDRTGPAARPYMRLNDHLHARAIAPERGDAKVRPLVTGHLRAVRVAAGEMSLDFGSAFDGEHGRGDGAILRKELADGRRTPVIDAPREFVQQILDGQAI